MNLKQLEYFLAVSQERQITAAAKKLNIAQPPLSYQLKQLEKELDTKLFNRTAYGIELTEQGEEFQKYAQKILSLAQNAKENISNFPHEKFSKIRLGLMSSTGVSIFNDQLKNLTKRYPDLTFEIAEDNTFGIIDKLKDNLVDLAIVRTPFNKRGLYTKLILNDRMVAIFQKDKYNIEKEYLKLDDLKKLPLILYRRFEAIFNDSFAHNGIKPFYAVKCDDARTAILWAKEGMGVALVPESIAKVYDNDYVLVNHKSWESEVELVWKKDRKLKNIEKEIISYFD